MRFITEIALKKKIITITILSVLAIAGILSYFRHPQAEDPGFVVRWAQIVTYLPGASPERMENLITDKLEKTIQEIPQLDYITSESRTGLSVIQVVVKDRYSKMRPIWDTLRRKVEKVKPTLPEEIVGPFVDDEFGDVFGTIITVSGEGYSYKQLKELADVSKKQLYRLDEVAKVEILGNQEEKIFVEYLDAKLAELNLSGIQLQRILAERNIINPGGDIESGNERIILEPSGNYETIEELENTIITLPGHKDVIYLKDIANIYRGYDDPPKAKIHSSGKPALAIAVSLIEDGNITKLGREVKQLVKSWNHIYPIGVEFDVVAFQPFEVSHKIHQFLGNLIQSVLIVMVCMILFLGFRTGFVVATLIPMTILCTSVLMYCFSIGVDQVSLAALIIALGMLVDNAIVMSESILTEMKEGVSPFKAAVQSANELAIPLLISSLTTVVAFLPIYMAKSAAGEYTGSLFTVVSIALLSSWILSLTMTPLLCVYYLKKPKKAPHQHFFLEQYEKILRFSLKEKGKLLLFALACFIAAMLSIIFIPKSFFPSSDRALFTLELELPIGTKLNHTDQVVSEVEIYLTKLQGTDGIENWSAYIGGSAPKYTLNYMPEPPKTEKAFFLINTTTSDSIHQMIDKIDKHITAHFPEVHHTLKRVEHGPPVVSPVSVRISGPEIGKISDRTQDTENMLAQINGVKNIRNDWGEKTKKIVVRINQPRARRAGITNRDIALSLQTLLSGFEATYFREDADLIPITIRSVSTDRHNISKLESLNVHSQTRGYSVPLKQVADVEILWEPSRIFRRDRTKTITVKADLEKGYNAQSISNKLSKVLYENKKSWPMGYYYEMGGEIEVSNKSSRSIYEQIPIAFLIIVLLLVLQFNSIKLPFIILLTIPMGLIGVILGLLMTQTQYGFMSFLGIVSLSGIVVNNAIVLLDRIEIEQKEHHLSPFNSIIVAAKRRFRPILLTTLTTIGGLTPLWLNGGPLFRPMAIVIIFGLLFATLLTLGFIPLLYATIFKVKEEVDEPNNKSSTKR